MLYEIGIYYPSKEHDAQVKLANIPITANRRRFWFNGRPTPHWDEDDTTWVKVPVLNGMTKIYVDDSANKDLSNIDETMIFGDDFRNEIELNVSKWQPIIIDGTITIDNSLHIHGTTSSTNSVYLLSLKQFSINTIMSVKGYMTGYYPLFAYNDGSGTSDEANNLIGIGRFHSTYDYLYARIDGPSNDNSLPSYSGKTKGIYEIIWNDQYIDFAFNSAVIAHISTNIPTADMYVDLGGGAYNKAYGFDEYVDYIFVHKYLPSDPIVKYIQPYSKLFYIRNTTFTQSNDILSYKTNSYMETPIIEILDDYYPQVNSLVNMNYYYRYSDTQPDITQSGTIVDSDNVFHNYWDQNIITNSGWNDTTPSSYITCSNNTTLNHKYIQFKIPLEYNE